KEAAYALAARGWDVLLQCKTASAEITHSVDDLNRKFGGKAAYIRADFTDEAERAGLIRTLSETYGTLDAVVNAAGLPVGTLHDAFAPVETAVVLAQELARQLPKGKTGAFVQIIRPASGFNGILAQKALETFVDEFQVQNVRLVCAVEEKNCIETVVSGLDSVFADSLNKAK
ncbi:MAG TPA: hypothetical protein DD624_08390, partial [Alphaproteobacteria bacterium]|nr:hypothetical protein [Alphaproteobacteria bacterium]